MSTTIETTRSTVPNALSLASFESITLKGRKVTRAKVFAAIAECKRMGKVAFLAAKGYRDSVRWHLRHEGNSYPSKAILGVAAGLKHDDFFGGAAHTVQQLATLGFHVRNSQTGEVADAKLDFLRRACEREGLSCAEPAWREGAVAPSHFFASGSNQPGEIRGMARAGADIGVTATHVAALSEAELHKLAGSDVEVFVDSGAFSEVKFNKTTFQFDVVKPITHEQWTKRLSLYKRLSESLGSQVYLTAPDRVGSQEETFERLNRYKAEIAECRRNGARILVAMQKGALTQAQFAVKVDEILGTDWLPAMPCNKAATTPAEVAEFVRIRQPKHVHLLGVGIRGKMFLDYLAAFENANTSVSLDSCWITSVVGRTNGPNKGPRSLTRARDVAKKILKRTPCANSILSAAQRVIELAVYCCLAGPGLVRN